jgi:hypothetical protein
MRRSSLAFLLTISLAVALAGVAIATTANASPETQSHAHGVASTWSGTWSGTSPFYVKFNYGDGYSWIAASTTATSHNWSHTYWPCTYTTFHPYLYVVDDNENSARDDLMASESGGSCK